MLLTNFHRVFPTATHIDDGRGFHCPLTDEVSVIDVAQHVDAVPQQMQVQNPRLGVAVQSSKYLTVCKVCRPNLMPLPLADYLVNLVKLTDELPAEIVPILRIPVLTLFRRWGKYQHNPLLVYRMSCKLSTIAVEVQLHLVPHPHRGQPLTEVMHHNKVCPKILRDVVRHGRATLNSISHSCHTRIPVK